MTSPFARRLEHGAELTDGDRAALVHLVRNARCITARHVLAIEDDRVPRVFSVLSGWACRCKILAGGQRQITNLLLPGDTCHLHTGIINRIDDVVATLTPCTIAEIDPADLALLLAARPNAARALWWSSLQTDAVLREALVNVGSRQADQRLAHLICEVTTRLWAVDLVESDDGGVTFAWPLTQTDVAEVTGMTSVHVNRTLRALRFEGLIFPVKRMMHVPDPKRLAAFCGFRPDYLHLGPEATQTAA